MRLRALLASVQALKPLLDASSQKQIDAAADSAVRALEDYRQWLIGKLDSMSPQSAIGARGYVYFLKNVALLPYSPQQLLEIGRQEWARSVSFQTYEEHHHLGDPELPLPTSIDEEIARERRDEEAVRKYLRRETNLSVPAWVQHYTWHANACLHEASRRRVAESDDFTSANRLKEDCVRYIDPPSSGLGYFALGGCEGSAHRYRA